MVEDVVCCAMCGGSVTSPLESTREFFRPTLTLKRTLEMLGTGISVSKFDSKNLFDVLTSQESSSICFKCSSILHTSLQVTAQILLLESRLRNLGARIRTTTVTQSCINNRPVRKSARVSGVRIPHDFSFRELFSASTKVSLSNENEPKNQDADAQNKTKEPGYEPESSEEFQPQPKPDSSRNPRRKTKNLNPPQTPPKDNNPRDTAKTTKRSSLSSPSTKSPPSFPPRTRTKSPRRKLPPGTQHCPSCDFSIDLRSPSQVQPSKPLAYPVREAMRKKAREKLVLHFRDTHMPSTAKDNFNIGSDGIRVYACPGPNCNFTHVRFTLLVSHVIQSHVKVDTSQSSGISEPSTYSCPEKNCSFAIEVSQIPRGIDAQRHAKNTLAAHVFGVHDIPSNPSLGTPKKRNKERSLFVEVGSGTERRKAYRCTRCDYEDQLPKDVSHSQYNVSRCTFLRHFYDAHLT